jgi:hypothetical protein
MLAGIDGTPVLVAVGRSWSQCMLGNFPFKPTLNFLLIEIYSSKFDEVEYLPIICQVVTQIKTVLYFQYELFWSVFYCGLSIEENWIRFSSVIRKL